MLMLTVLMIGVISTLPFLIPYRILMNAQSRKTGYKQPVGHIVIVYIFICYLAGVLVITEISTIRDIFHYSFGLEYPKLLNSPPKINLIPFRWITEGIRPYIENIALFIPFGFLLPSIWKEYEVLWKTAVTGLAFSLIIELSQLFNGRVSDIDDLLMNTLGAFIGWAIFMLLRKLLSKLQIKASAQSDNIEKKPLLLRREAYFYIVGAIAGISVFFPFLRSLL